MSERERGRTEREDLSEAANAIWKTHAAFWDQGMSEGNSSHQLLVGPATERLLALREGEHVLEIACGNGVMARRLG